MSGKGKEPQGDLFAQRQKRSRVGAPGLTRRPGGAEHAPVDETNAARAQLVARLEVIALGMGLLHGAEGFMVSDVRHEAMGRGLLTGHEGAPVHGNGPMVKPRELAWLGAFLPGMARRGLVDKLVLGGRVQFGGAAGERSHGNKNVLWILTPRGERVARLLADRRHGCSTVAQAEALVNSGARPE